MHYVYLDMYGKRIAIPWLTPSMFAEWAEGGIFHRDWPRPPVSDPQDYDLPAAFYE